MKFHYACIEISNILRPQNYLLLYLYAYKFCVTLDAPVTDVRLKGSTVWPKYYFYKVSNRLANS